MTIIVDLCPGQEVTFWMRAKGFYSSFASQETLTVTYEWNEDGETWYTHLFCLEL